MVFEQIKKQMRKSLRTSCIISAVIMALAIIFAFCIGFSSDFDFMITLKGTGGRSGIPVPNWLLSGVAVIIAIIALIHLITSLTDIIKNKTYNEFIKSVEKIGDVNAINNLISNTQICPFVINGEFRINNMLCCYYDKGTSCEMFLTANITEIQPIIKNIDNGKSKSYSLKITFIDFDGVKKYMTFKTTEDNLMNFAKTVAAYVESANKQSVQN